MRIFIVLFLIVYSVINLYGAGRWLSTLEKGYLRTFLTLLSLIGALSYPVARLSSAFLPQRLWVFMLHIGEIWMAFLPHIFLVALLWDISRGILRLFGGAPSVRVNWLFFSIWTGLMVVIVVIGAVNGLYLAIKKVPLPPSLIDGRIVFISDLHIGPTTSDRWTERLVARVNSLKPDMILIGGDVFDGSDGPLEGKAQILSGLKAPLGVYGVFGNHEYYIGTKEAEKLFKKSSITLLRDRSIMAGNMWIVGREDVQSPSMGGSRSPLESLMPEDGGPVIVMDHTPAAIEESVKNGVDLLLCGHTHHGQLSPFQIVTSMIYKIDWGLETIEQTNIYVSCGAGTWGPPIRTSSRPEIVVFDGK